MVGIGLKSSLLQTREALVARHDAALERWPQRTGNGFVREMTSVAAGLEALARATDDEGGDLVERCRTWRFAGLAYFDLGNGKNLPEMQRAVDMYRQGDARLAGVDNPIERMKLDYSYGHALFHLSDARDLRLLQEARRRYASALEIARAKMPAGIESASTALANADRLTALLTEAEGLSQRITALEKQKEAGDTEEVAASDYDALFSQLLDVYRKDVAVGKVSDTRQQALDPVLSQLGRVLQRRPTDLASMTTQRSRLTELMASMSHLVEDTSHGVPTPPAGSRAEATWKRFSRLKLYLSRDLMRPHMASEERSCGMEIYKRCGYADTFLHQSGRDDDTAYAYEADVLRQLACEVRAFSLRNHLTLISPVWPSSPLPQNPNAVFFSGGEALAALLAKTCANQRLKLLAQVTPKDFASTRWDQLRACHVALFDFTGYVRPDVDQPIDLAKTGPVAAVSYELGIALTLGRAIVVLANEGQDLPFDLDIEPIRLQGDGRDGARIAGAINEAMYGLQRGGEDSAIAATRDYLNERFSGGRNFIVAQSLKLIDDDVARDPVKFRRFVEPILGSSEPNAPQIVFPAWPGSYPRPGLGRCFHVSPFRPAWAGETMKIVAAACKTAKPSLKYIRGDQVPDPNIIRSIWDNLSQASHVVVDLTGLNANVALELGIAHTLGRNVLLVTQDANLQNHFPALAKTRVRRYSLSGEPGLAPLHAALHGFLRSA